MSPFIQPNSHRSFELFNGASLCFECPGQGSERIQNAVHNETSLGTEFAQGSGYLRLIPRTGVQFCSYILTRLSLRQMCMASNVRLMSERQSRYRAMWISPCDNEFECGRSLWLSTTIRTRHAIVWNSRNDDPKQENMLTCLSQRSLTDITRQWHEVSTQYLDGTHDSGESQLPIYMRSDLRINGLD